ncbi:hypothetical protein BDW42DRAFT_197675 [Aspergillus taichungensis]|uniref:Ig-like domain-containing protein n=1 Tax=Aspergillus taichungensis TaxID=482145 RepID=A0A2J5HFA5_9EURO|nr:hypothetical protein BDW42DRAFT_197675 [Aspergillus taichungensis]
MKLTTASILTPLAPLVAANVCSDNAVAIGINLKNELAVFAQDCGVINWLPGHPRSPVDICKELGDPQKTAPWEVKCADGKIIRATHTKSDAVDHYTCRYGKDSGCSRAALDISYCCDYVQPQ